MTARITADGILEISSQNQTEAYALKRWVDERMEKETLTKTLCLWDSVQIVCNREDWEDQG